MAWYVRWFCNTSGATAHDAREQQLQSRVSQRALHSRAAYCTYYGEWNAWHRDPSGFASSCSPDRICHLGLGGFLG
eukprot:11186112-Alexandrium_andersonii.AAC.1